MPQRAVCGFDHIRRGGFAFGQRLENVEAADGFERGELLAQQRFELRGSASSS